jgi:hypothetical protein
MLSYKSVRGIESLIAPDAIEGKTPTDGRSEYVGERRPLASGVALQFRCGYRPAVHRHLEMLEVTCGLAVHSSLDQEVPAL